MQNVYKNLHENFRNKEICAKNFKKQVRTFIRAICRLFFEIRRAWNFNSTDFQNFPKLRNSYEFPFVGIFVPKVEIAAWNGVGRCPIPGSKFGTEQFLRLLPPSLLGKEMIFSFIDKSKASSTNKLAHYEIGVINFVVPPLSLFGLFQCLHHMYPLILKIKNKKIKNLIKKISRYLLFFFFF